MIVRRDPDGDLVVAGFPCGILAPFLRFYDNSPGGRDQGGGVRRLEGAIQDLKSSVRLLRTKPGFALVVVLTLALGIGANTALFGIVDAVVFRPLPFVKSERLVALWERNPRRGLERERVSPPDFEDWRQQNKTFDQLAFWSGEGDFNLMGTDGSERIRAIQLENGWP
jgi:hypothetical protein